MGLSQLRAGGGGQGWGAIQAPAVMLMSSATDFPSVGFLICKMGLITQQPPLKVVVRIQ